MIARLKGGVSQERAASDMNTVAKRLEEEYPSTNGGWTITLVGLDEQLFGPSRPSLLMLLGAVSLVLLIVCLNVANLLLARGAARRKELAIRAALGAGKARLVRQLLTESLALAAAGGAAGLLLARLVLASLVELAPAHVPRLDESAISGAVVGFTFALSLLVGLVFGFAPAWQGTSLELATWLKEKGAGESGAGRRFDLKKALVVAEVGLSLILLVGSGLLVTSFLRLQGIDPGFQPANVLTLGVTLPSGRYPERATWTPAFEEIERRVAALPGVEAAGWTLELPLDGDRQGTVILHEDEVELTPETRRQVNFTFVTPGYFSAMTVPLVRGRIFGREDHAEAPPVILVNEALAERYFPGQDPIGRRLKVGFNLSTPRQIVGVVGDVRHDKLTRGGFPGVYVPFSQVPWGNRMSLAVRTTAAPYDVLPAVRHEIRSVDAGIPVYSVRSLGRILARALAPQRFSALLLAAFAALALVLAAVGIYGVVAYSVTQRTREIGVRVALGARAGDVVAMVLRQGMAMTAAGVAVGCLGALGLTRLVAGQLYEVSAGDPSIFAAVVVLLAAVAFVACWLPARRASTVDPTVALRDE